MRIRGLIYLGILIMGTACKNDDIQVLPSSEWPALMEIPTGFPEVPEPSDNAFTKERWELGKRLFFDKRFSSDQSISCASCHKQSIAFSDDVAKSIGVENRTGFRNAPSLTNVAYHPYYTREGGIQSLEQQIAVPIQEHDEFNNNIVELAALLQADPDINQQALNAYGRAFDPYVLTRALACFERSFISGFSPYDLYINNIDQEAMSDIALRGMDLFFSDELACSSCHSGFNFTNYAFENNGLYLTYADSGRYRLTFDTLDIARFKVPSLRNIALTAPYMHDGSIVSLEEVIDHYSIGGFNHKHKSNLIQGFELNNSDKQALQAFLESLTDDTFITNPIFAEP